MDKIQVAICDDSQYLCANYESFIEYEDDMEVGLSVHSCRELENRIKNIKIDVLLLDIQIESEKAGIEVIPFIKEISPQTKIIMLTSYDDDELVYEAFAEGADDYFVKTRMPNELLEAIRGVWKGSYSIDSNIVQKLVRKTKDNSYKKESFLYSVNTVSKLSQNEIDLLLDIHSNKSYNEIAKERFVEDGSVRKMASRIIKKLGFKSMDEVIMRLNEMDFFALIKNKGDKNSEK